jgi:phage head maturation protease
MTLPTGSTFEGKRYLPRTREAPNVSEKGEIRFVAATADPVDMGGWNEVLKCDDGVVDSRAATALLINHDPNQIAGKLGAAASVNGGREIEQTATILADAKTTGGLSVLEIVRAGILSHVSVRYQYGVGDYEDDEDSRTRTVHRWRLVETSLTPIPADPRASIRSLTDHPNPGRKPEGVPMPDGDTSPSAAIAAAITEAREIADLAASHKLNPSDFIGKPKAEACAEMLRQVAARATPPAPASPVPPVATVTVDVTDKLMGACRSSLHAIAGLKMTVDEERDAAKTGTLNARLNTMTMCRAVAKSAGMENADFASNLDVASFIVGNIDLRTHGRRDAANKTSGLFSNLLANVASKKVQLGLDSYTAATWPLWTTRKDVTDFRAVTHTGLQSGYLTKIAENAPAPELDQKDGGYSATLQMYAATVSLTTQAIVNDELGIFMRDLQRVGATAMKTIDYEVYKALLQATWTNDVSTSAGLATAANIDIPRQALVKKPGPAGILLGNQPRFLLHSLRNAVAAQTATGAIYRQNLPAAPTALPSMGSAMIQPVESPWIDDTTLLGGALYTDYYLVADPNLVDTVTVSFLQGLGLAPMIMPRDPGSVFAERWLIGLPFVATVATHSDGTNTRITGIQKATA